MGTESHCPASLPSSCGTYRHATTISMLCDNVLLEIFDFYRSFYLYLGIWKWHVLAHVCQRWRQVVFASPHRLHLRILYNYGTPVRNLAIWPAFPIVISPYPYSWSSLTPKDEGNLIATLKHVDRLCSVTLVVTGPQLKKMARVVQAQFPVLTRLGISSKDGKAQPLPRRFLGGSAPRLQQIHLDGILYPALPTLLLSTSDLVSLKLCRVPPAGYISPKVMVACLAALPRLTSLLIDFKLITPHPNQMHPPPVTRVVLPALTNFRFEGAGGYLEDLVSRIDSPQLLRIDVFYSDGFVDNHIAPLLAPLSEFVHRLVHGSELTTFGRVDISLWSGQVDFALRQANPNYPDWDRRPGIDISCRANIRQLSQIAQVLSQFSAIRSTVVHLELGVPIRVIFESDTEIREAHLLKRTDDSEWFLLLQQFPAMRTLHVFGELSKHVALALERTGEMAAELLPFLDLICLAGQPASSIEKFVTARQLSDRPVIVTDRYTEYADRLKPYVSK